MNRATQPSACSHIVVVRAGVAEVKPITCLPCTVSINLAQVMYGKTSKAASRIQSNWKHVQKTYICVLDRQAADIETLLSLSTPIVDKDDEENKNSWYHIDYKVIYTRMVELSKSKDLLRH